MAHFSFFISEVMTQDEFAFEEHCLPRVALNFKTFPQAMATVMSNQQQLSCDTLRFQFHNRNSYYYI